MHFEADVTRASRLRSSGREAFAFQFIEGMLLKAAKNGHWLFLDEINLAPPEALHTLAAVLENDTHVALNLPDGATSLERHPAFRLIGAMNPATDFGKRDLAAPLRNKFTEIWFSEPNNKEDLGLLVSGYLDRLGPFMPISRIVDFYLKAKEEADGGLTDGAGQSPCYTLRTLRRFLEYVQAMASTYGLQRALHDGASMAFCTQLDTASMSEMSNLIQTHLLVEKLREKQLMRAPPRPPGNVVLFEQFWLETGPEGIPVDDSIKGVPFVCTSSIRSNLRSLSRAVAMR